MAELPELPFSGQGRGGYLEDLNERSDVTMLLLLLTLRTPAQALAQIDYYGVGAHHDLVVALVLARDPAWRADFVRVAGALPLRSGWQAIDTAALYRVVCAVCDHDGLALPDGEALVHGWMAACTPPRAWVGGRFEPADEAGTVARVRADGRYVERVPHALAHPAIGEFTTIGGAVVDLVGSGDLDRADVVARCLTELDSPGRPSHQKALAGILAGLGLRAAEVPGGLARVQQLLATCHGTVTAVLLPLALDLLGSRGDVEELTATVAARPEKKQRTELLRALSGPQLRARLGDDAVGAGLEILTESPDAALAGRARTALAKLGGPGGPGATPGAPAPPARRLWDLTLEPPTSPYPPVWGYAEPALLDRQRRESLLRGDRVPFELSSPSRPDGTLDLEVLADRLRGSAEVGFGPLDLLLAMLRLRPVEASRADELADLPAVPPDPAVATACSVVDAVAHVREAVAAGRVQPQPPTPEVAAEAGWLDSAQPDDAFWVALLPTDPRFLGSDLDELTGPGTAVAPWCPDLGLRGHLWAAPDVRAFRPGPLGGPGPVGVAVQDWLLRQYADGRPMVRTQAVEATLRWIAEQRMGPTAGLTAAAGRLAHGRLNLARCASAWEQVFLSGGMRVAWPIALGTAGLAAQQPRKPAGLADLLRMLTGYVREVPDPTLPAAITGLAAQKGSTKGHAEARLLVAALEAP